MNQALRGFAVPAILFGRTSRVSLLLLLLASTLASAQPERRIIPRHKDGVHLPELGRIINSSPGDCGFGGDIYSIGDCNNDGLGDWIVTRIHCDTQVNGTSPVDLMLYRGVRGGLPDGADFIRIGVDDITINVKFIAAGDWDGDGHLDIAAKVTPLLLDSITNPIGYFPTSMAIWWGNAEGNYSNDDTSHLDIDSDAWLGPRSGKSRDWNDDGVEDLLLDGIVGFENGEINRNMAPTGIWFGDKVRWGRGRKATVDWEWWSKWNYYDHDQLIDQDVDGLIDWVFHFDGSAGERHGRVRIMYGKAGVILDTNNAVEISLDSAWGKRSLLSDITGDKIPDLLVNTGGQEAIKVFVGFHKQRIVEQYGLGNEPPHPGDSIWWGKPWAIVPLPGQLHDGWAAAGWSTFRDWGDGGLDGVGDIWVVTVPDYVCYQGGWTFDSIYDGWITPPCGAFGGGRVDNIDGSGKWSFGWAYACDGEKGIVFYQPTSEMPWTGRERAMPPGTTEPVSVINEGFEFEKNSIFGLAVDPNPTSGNVAIQWNPDHSGSEATIVIADVLGQLVMSATIPVGKSSMIWDASRTFDGNYYVTLTIGQVSESLVIRIQK